MPISSTISTDRIIEAVSKRRTPHQEAVLARFDTHLSSYARARNVPRNGLHMFALESKLLESVEKRPRFLQSDRPFLVAVLGIVSGLFVFETVASGALLRRSGEYEERKMAERSKLVEESAKWFVAIGPTYLNPLRYQKRLREVRTSLTNLLKLFEV